MTWSRFGDEHFDNSDRLDMSRDARLFEAEAIIWSNRLGTDGAISSRYLRRFTDADDPAACAAELVAHGFWETTATGWQVIGWADQQPTAAEVAARKADTRKRVDRHRKHKAGDHTACTPGLCKSLPTPPPDAPVTRYETRTNGVSNDPPTRPDPTRPDPKGGTGSGEGQKPAAEAASGRPGGLPVGTSTPRKGVQRVTFQPDDPWSTDAP